MIKVFLADVDGCLTDGVYQMDEDGKIRKNFYTRDFHGMWMLDKAGVEVGIITYASDDVIVHQCKRGAKYATLMNGAKDKLGTVQKRYIDHGYSWDEIAFISDDILDLDLMKKCGFVACPSDADSVILELVGDLSMGDGYVCKFPGGRGCVREFAKIIMEYNELQKDKERYG